jgi:hypothetical protein
MGFIRLASAAATCLALLASGCVAHESVGRPPSPGEVARINEAAAGRGRGLRVEYVDPLSPCGGGSCGAAEARTAARGELVIHPRSIAFCDDRQITFNTASGATQTIPTAAIKGVTARSSERERSAVIGAATGLGLGVVAALAGYVAANALSDPNAPKSSCDGCAAEVLIGLPVILGLVGLGVGYAIGAPRVFTFGDSPTDGR